MGWKRSSAYLQTGLESDGERSGLVAPGVLEGLAAWRPASRDARFWQFMKPSERGIVQRRGVVTSCQLNAVLLDLHRCYVDT